ncbi:MAG: hypothetical protein KAS32_18310 [Candidatus Peribacteraceae bacterium]|nr:hypothetical protein [Candidatus Peribacteraceae bacterium]
MFKDSFRINGKEYDVKNFKLTLNNECVDICDIDYEQVSPDINTVIPVDKPQPFCPCVVNKGEGQENG